MDQLMKEIDAKVNDRAIEVGCGDGRYTVDHLIKKFAVVDMFDLDKDVIEKVRDLKEKYTQIYRVE